MSKTHQSSPRRYPPLLEKLIPFFIGMIVLLMMILMVVAAGVVLDWIG